MKPTEIKTNSQRNNKKIGHISAGSQCGYTSVAMALSKFYKEAETDEFVAWMVDDIEPKVGNKGWAENFFERKGWKSGWIYQQVFSGKFRAGAFFSVYAEWTKDFIVEKNLPIQVEFIETRGDWKRVQELLQSGVPVVIGTRILPSGHFVLLVDYDPIKKEYTIKDPWGNPLKNYKDHNGDNIKVPENWLHEKAPDAQNNKNFCRYLALIPK